MYILNTDYRLQIFRAFKNVCWSRLTLKSTVYVVISQSSSGKSNQALKKPARTCNTATLVQDWANTPRSAAAGAGGSIARTRLQQFQLHVSFHGAGPSRLHGLDAVVLFSLVIAVCFNSTVTTPKVQNLLWQTVCSYGNSNVSVTTLKYSPHPN